MFNGVRCKALRNGEKISPKEKRKKACEKTSSLGSTSVTGDSSRVLFSSHKGRGRFLCEDTQRRLLGVKLHQEERRRLAPSWWYSRHTIFSVLLFVRIQTLYIINRSKERDEERGGEEKSGSKKSVPVVVRVVRV